MIRVCTLHFGTRVYFSESIRFGESYCARHGYSWHVLPAAQFPDNRDLRWSKIPGVASIMRLPNTDFVFYLDADAVVSNPKTSIDRLVNLMKGKDILIGEDSPRHINTGVWLARPSALDILDYWNTTPMIDGSLKHRWPVDEAGFNEYVIGRYCDRIAVKTRGELDLVNGFVYHQMAGNQAHKQQQLTNRNRRS